MFILHRTVVANVIPDNFGLIRPNPWQPLAKPCVSAESQLENTNRCFCTARLPFNVTSKHLSFTGTVNRTTSMSQVCNQRSLLVTFFGTRYQATLNQPYSRPPAQHLLKVEQLLLELFFSIPNSRTQMSSGKTLNESARTRDKQVCCNTLTQ